MLQRQKNSKRVAKQQKQKRQQKRHKQQKQKQQKQKQGKTTKAKATEAKARKNNNSNKAKVVKAAETVKNNNSKNNTKQHPTLPNKKTVAFSFLLPVSFPVDFGQVFFLDGPGSFLCLGACLEMLQEMTKFELGARRIMTCRQQT